MGVNVKEKYEWAPGPWDNEPNRIEFESHGFPVIMRRHPRMGNWCGYVAVPPGHPCHGLRHNNLPDLSAHGGVNYAEPCTGDICHVPKEGEPADVWWLGFDCGHCFDMTPWMEAQKKKMDFASDDPDAPWCDVYRDADYVRSECENLAAQLEQLR
jgi:hypothetical protein